MLPASIFRERSVLQAMPVRIRLHSIAGSGIQNPFAPSALTIEQRTRSIYFLGSAMRGHVQRNSGPRICFASQSSFGRSCSHINSASARNGNPSSYRQSLTNRETRSGV